MGGLRAHCGTVDSTYFHCLKRGPEYGYVLDERRAGRTLELHVHRVCDQLERAELTCARVAAGLEADLAGIVEAEPTKVVVRIHV